MVFRDYNGVYRKLAILGRFTLLRMPAFRPGSGDWW